MSDWFNAVTDITNGQYLGMMAVMLLLAIWAYGMGKKHGAEDERLKIKRWLKERYDIVPFAEKRHK